MAHIPGTHDTSIMYSEIEESREQENEGQRGDCSTIVNWSKGGGGGIAPARQ